MNLKKPKILIVDSYYPAFLADLYKKFPSLMYKNYQHQLDTIMSQFFGTFDAYSYNLKTIGWEAGEVIGNYKPIQMQWARENNLTVWKNFLDDIPGLRIYLKSDWQEKILDAQIKKFNPDIIYCQDLHIPQSELLRKYKGKKLIVGQVASPIDFSEPGLKVFDIVLTSIVYFVKEFKQHGINSEYFKIGFDQRILKHVKKTKKQYGAVFVGGFSRHHLKNANFLEYFEYAANHSHIDFFGYGGKNIPNESPIKKTYHDKVPWGLDMYNIFYNSKISINRHIDVAGKYANNMRLYESTGVGSLLLTDAKKNLHTLFDIGKEVVTYESKNDLLEKLNFYLNHDTARKKIALAGQKRTLAQHTYANRMVELDRILRRYL